MMIGCLLLLVLAAAPASERHHRAVGPPAALQAELHKHAARNSWPAVEDAYARLAKLGDAPAPADHLLGARAALYEGLALLAWERLQRIPDASSVDPVVRRDAERLTKDLQQQFSFVHLVVPEPLEPTLLRPYMPFPRHERAAVRHAVEAVAQDRAYRGLLPIGVYELAGLRFQVLAAWPEWKEVVADDPRTGDPDAAPATVPTIPPPSAPGR